MALDSGNVRLAPSGHIYIADFGTTLPTSTTDTLDAAFKELGYTSDDGVSVTPSVDTSGIKAWQSAVDVKTVITGVGLDVKFSMIEVTQDSTANYFFGSSWSNSLGEGLLAFSSNPSLAERSVVLDWLDDLGYDTRLVLDRGIITDRDAMQLQRTQATALGVTFHVLDNSGTLGRIYSANPDLIPAT